MIVEIAKIPPAGMRLQGEEPAECLELQDADLAEPAGPVRYDLTVRLITGELVVTGAVRVEMQFVCSRCGESFKREVAEPACAFARETSELGACVDLTPQIREAILLAFPSYPVCRIDCAGRCPFCGGNLNRMQCDCRPPAEERWKALDGLS